MTSPDDRDEDRRQMWDAIQLAALSFFVGVALTAVVFYTLFLWMWR